MTALVILILSSEPIIYPRNKHLSCSEQGEATIQVLSTYYDQTPTRDQGWYTKEGKLVYAFFCEWDGTKNIQRKQQLLIINIIIPNEVLLLLLFPTYSHLQELNEKIEQPVGIHRWPSPKSGKNF